MASIFFLLLCISYSYAYYDDETLTSLQTLDHWNTFRIIIPHNDEECFYVNIKQNDTIHVIYQVLKGGDYYITANIKGPSGDVVFTQRDTAIGWYEESRVAIAGVYELCFRNERYFTTKYLYIGVLAAHRLQILESAIKTIQEQNINETVIIDDFSKKTMTTLNKMSSTLYQMTAYQTLARVQHAHDVYFADANRNYIQKWALGQIGLMIICSFIQVFFIRRLFKSTIPKKTNNKSNSSQAHFINNNDFFIIN